MSNSIWRKKYGFVVDKNGQVIVKLDDGTYDIIWVCKGKPLQDVIVYSENGIKFIEEYCYIDDLIAQADKAEQLQKAVDKAIWILEESKKVQRPDFKLGFTYCLFPQPHLDIILDEIKQLIKGE